MHVLYCHPARFYKRPHRFGGEVFYLYCSLAALEWVLGLLERPQATGTATEKNKKTSDFGLTLNYRFWEVPMLAETVYFLRKNSINLSTFGEKKLLTCLLFRGKDRQFITFSQKRYKRYKRYTFESKDSSTPAFSVITPTFDHFTTYFTVFFMYFYGNFKW